MPPDERNLSAPQGSGPSDETKRAPDSVPPTPHEPAAYQKLFSRYAPSVCGYLQRRGLSRTTAEELTQEVMLTVWRKAEQYDANKAPLRTWVFTIARNRCIDQFRRSARSMPDPDDPAWVETVHQPTGPEAEMVGQRREARLQRALSQLSPDHREALQRLYYEGKTSEEAAASLGVPVGTVKSRARRALVALRSQLAEGGVDEL